MEKSDLVNLNDAKKEMLNDAIKTPNKEITMDKVELANLRGLDQQLAITNNNIGALTRDYEKKKKMLLAKGDDIENKITQYIETLKKKYKIISLKNIDFGSGKISIN